MRILRKSICMLMVITMIVSLFSVIEVDASADQGTSYIVRSWNAETKTVETEQLYRSDCTELSKRQGSVLSGWYAVHSNTSIGNRLFVDSGAAHIILCDGATLSLSNGITVAPGAQLYIYGQSEDSGKLYAHVDDTDYRLNSILGGSERNGGDCGDIIIYGGSFDMKKSSETYLARGACIGGGEYGAPSIVEIYGGNFKLHQVDYGACIGGGDEGPASNYNGEGIRIYGGTFDLSSSSGACIGTGLDNESSSGSIGIYGGKIDAKAIGKAAPIGGGYNASNPAINISNAEITVRASGNKKSGAGIGGGAYGYQENPINITDSKIFAIAINGAGIGGGYDRSASTINITNSEIAATSMVGGAGIGGGKYGSNGGTITITGCKKVDAVSKAYNSSDAMTASIEKQLEGLNMAYTPGVEYSYMALGMVELFADLIGKDMSGAGIGGGIDGSFNSITIIDSTVNAESSNYSAAIGSGDEGDKYTGNITIRNSTVTATSGTDAAAIGGGNECDVDTISIIDSDITAKSGGYAAAIGGGDDGGFNKIDINHSTVYARAGSYGAGIGNGEWAKKTGTINITNDSNVTASSNREGAGVGTGNEVDGKVTINITDSTVEARGGNYAAGVGGGDDGDVDSITIRNSDVRGYAGKDAAGIGGGEGGDGGNIRIYDSSILADGRGCGSGIGNGEDGDKTSVHILGDSTVTAYGGNSDASAIGKADNGAFYNYHVSALLDRELFVDAGPDAGHLSFYQGNSRYDAVFNHTYAEIYPCKHTGEKEWVYMDSSFHIRECVDCGHAFEFERHEWDSDNVCTVCGASAELITLTFTEKNSTDSVSTSVQIPKGSAYIMPECTNVPDGYEFVCWQLNAGEYFIPGEKTSFITKNATAEAVYLPLVDTSFIDADGKETSVKARKLTAAHFERGLSLTSGWYVADGEFNVEHMMYICGDVNLIITDGSAVNFLTEYNPSPEYAADDRPSVGYTALNIFGQSAQTGEFNTGRSPVRVKSFGLYGGKYQSDLVVMAKEDFRIAAGTFNGTDIDQPQKSAVIDGGNVVIDQYNGEGDILLGWTKPQDSIRINSFYRINDVQLTVADGQYLTDGTNIYSGTLTTDQVRQIQGKTLKPYIHAYAQPEWEWSHEYTEAKAIFRCTDCDLVSEVDAKVTYEDSEKNRTATARCTFDGQEYSVTVTKKIIFDITIAGCDNGTVIANKSTARNGENITVQTTPDEGYILSELYFADDTGAKAEMDDDRFTMPESDVTVTAVFARYREVDYIDEDGNVKTVQAIPLTGEETALRSGWYFAEGNVSARDDIALSGSVNLILCNGATLNMGTKNLSASSDGSETALTVYRAPGDNEGRVNGWKILAGTVNLIGGQIDLRSMIEVNVLNGKGGSLSAERMDINTAFNLLGGSVDISTESGWAINCAGAINISGGTFTAGTEDGSTITCQGNVNISGGTVTIDGELSCSGDDTAVSISGGTVTINRIIKNGQVVNVNVLTVKNLVISGGNTQIKGELYSYGDVTLGWTKLSDSIMVYDYRSAHSLKIADGQEMTDGNHIYSGSLDLSELRWQLSGETLTPYVGTQWQTLQYRIDHAENGDTVTLDDNITATAEDTALRIPAGKTITLDLNGYTLDRNLDSAATDGSAIINNGTLTIDDSSRSGNGTITGAFNKTEGGALINNGTLTLNGGSITDNVATNGGGGIFNKGILMIRGGAICDNSVIGTGKNGGGIWTDNSLTISGGSITGNSSKTGNGGGISYNNGSVTVSGSPVIMDNTAGGSANDLHIWNNDNPDNKVTVNGALTENARIGIHTAVINASPFTSGLSGRGTVENFVSNHSDYTVRLNPDGEAVFKQTHTVTVDEAEHGSVEAPVQTACEGDTVTLSVTSDDNYSVKSVMMNGVEITPENGVYRFVMPNEDVTVSATFGFADDIGAALYGYSLSLDGDIGINFYMELSDAVAKSDTAKMHFTIPKNGEPDTKDIKVSDAVKVKSGDKTYYVFKCQVAAKEMTSNITARIIDGDKHGELYTYSVKEYADYLIAHAEENAEWAKAVPLVKAMLNYGAYSQVHFDKNSENLANAGLTEEEKALGDVSIDVADYDVSNLPESTTFEGATLSLKTETTLSLYFKSSSTLSFSCGDYKVETVKSNGDQIARIRGIKAKNIGNTFSLNVNGATVTYSPLNYCEEMIADDTQDEKLKNALKALYLYWQAADRYFE